MFSSPVAGAPGTALVRRPVFGNLFDVQANTDRQQKLGRSFASDEQGYLENRSGQTCPLAAANTHCRADPRGRQDKHIAEALNLSVPTVRTYLTRIFVRTDTPDRLGLVLHVFALAQGG